jgi:uncharacterized metal-binding protein
MNYTELYNETDRQILKDAEDALNPKVDRVQEIIEYARHTGIKTIGIANCITFNRQADELETRLVDEGFTVAKVNCKLGRVPFTDLVPGYKGISCNPADRPNT